MNFQTGFIWEKPTSKTAEHKPSKSLNYKYYIYNQDFRKNVRLQAEVLKKSVFLQPQKLRWCCSSVGRATD